MVSTNLSRSGMFVDLADVPPIGSELVCNLATCGGQSAIQIRGRITWHNGASGVGIEFVDLSDEQAEELSGLIGDGVEVPLGEQSAAVYELMELETADTCKTVVDDAVDAALDAQVDEATDDIGEMPSLDQGIEPPALPAESEPVPRYASVAEPAFTLGEVRAELPTEDTDRIVAPSRERRSWLLAAAVGTIGAVAIGMAGLGLFGSDDSADGPVVNEAQARDDQRQKVLALVGDRSHESTATERDEAIKRIRAAALDEASAEHGEDMAVGGPVFDSPSVDEGPTKPASKELVPTPIPAPEKKATRLVKRQVLGGVVVRESSESLIVRLPFTGTTEQESHYVMNEPPALAVNLPYAQPKKGFSQSLEPESEAVRLLWVRERLGGLHFRVFFKGERPTCKVETAKQELVLRCKY